MYDKMKNNLENILTKQRSFSNALVQKYDFTLPNVICF